MYLGTGSEKPAHGLWKTQNAYSLFGGTTGLFRVIPGQYRIQSLISLAYSRTMTEYAQQRRVPRYAFVAPAAVLPETGAPVGGNTKELSLYGCYIDATSTLAPRTKVLVKIFMPGAILRPGIEDSIEAYLSDCRRDSYSDACKPTG